MHRAIYICFILFSSITLKTAAFKYVKIEPDRYDDVIKYLKFTFFSDEPLNKAIKLCEPGEGHHDLEKHCRKTLEDGLSLMALTDDGDQVHETF